MKKIHVLWVNILIYIHVYGIYQTLLSKATYIHTLLAVAAMQGADQGNGTSDIPLNVTYCNPIALKLCTR